MPRHVEITTLSTTSDSDEDRCYDRQTCPGVHTVADRPGLHYCIVTEVTDPDELAAFAHLIGPGERLGTMPTSVIERMPR